MYLEETAHYNLLSEKLREELNEKLRGLGKYVRYKFSVGRKNPDPQNYNGDLVFPNLYTLDPTIFDIVDKDEEKGKPRLKKIALIDGVNEDGVPNRFKKIRVKGSQRGVLTLRLEEGNEDWYTAMFLELHPKMENGMFQDKTKTSVFKRIDEAKAASDAKQIRTARLKALNVAQAMSDKEVLNFSDAMLWDSTEEIVILRNKVEELADASPEFFNDLVSSKAIQYRSVIKQALDKKIIEYSGGEGKFTWESNQQPIAILGVAPGKTHVEKLAEYLMTNGDKAEAIFKKMKDLVK
jgi:hypothetical protein